MGGKLFKLGIIGWPLGYSLSPLMHNYALQASGLQGQYLEYPVETDKLEEWLSGTAGTLDGFNVTMPHKRRVWEWLKEWPPGVVSSEAAQMEAVNTVVVKEGRLVGYNTDGAGFLSAFHNAGLDLKGWEVVLLGSGGAAQAIAFSLAEAGIAKLTIWNRKENIGRVEEFIAKRLRPVLGSGSAAAAVSDLEALPVRESQLLVNATPMGMRHHPPVGATVLEKIHGLHVVYDIVYEPRETELIKAARRAGARAITGDVMLAGQGAISFELWTGKQWMQPVMQQALDGYFRGR
ncbi:MAG: shikimate dehydrogenase [Candidatus Omnitrophica bacterium]|nr:shikimate dehydrogenase [Candidatus Omnitrophota bacterium]